MLFFRNNQLGYEVMRVKCFCKRVFFKFLMKKQLYVSRKLPPHPINSRINFIKKRQLTNRAIHICNHSIWGNNRLKLDPMDTLVSIVKQTLVDSAGPTNRVNCPINKTKTVIKWASFSVNNFQNWLGLTADDSTAECDGCEPDRYNPKLDLLSCTIQERA